MKDMPKKMLLFWNQPPVIKKNSGSRSILKCHKSQPLELKTHDEQYKAGILKMRRDSAKNN